LKIGDFTIGVLAVQDYENENTYTENEQKILEVIAYSISRAIERKRLEKDRGRLIKRLEKMNSSKDKLFSLISHDLRSPFNSLLGFSEILTSEYESLTTEEIKEYIRAIYDSSKNLYSITNNLLQFSRFQMGKIEFKPTSMDLKLLVSDVVKLLKGNIVKKQLQISEEIEEDMKIFVDEDMLSSVLQNLISNAIKFTYKNGKISIKASKISIDNKAFLKIAISDNGVGISTFDLEKILEGNYYTTPGTDKEFGTGLGLSLVKEFIAKNGGTLEIKSKLKAGSTFTFTVPQTR
jgi:K+-sensing histidine kinase KdpD